MATAVSIREHIELNPNVRSGSPCITGTRVAVSDIVILHEQHGVEPSAIAEQYKGITVADVYAALTYYHDHADEIRAELVRAEEIEDRLAKESEATTRILLDRLRSRADLAEVEPAGSQGA